MVESGWFYGTFIDPVLVPMRKRILNEIQAGQKIIDVACGTGAQVFTFAPKASNAVGIDLSESMINKALQTKNKSNINNVEFFVEDATNLSRFSENDFDIATMSLALHQFEPQLHSPIINEIKRVAKTILIVDYAVPLPSNFLGIGSQVAEFFAGKEHHNNFKKYCDLGGLNKILPKNKLKIERSVLFGKGAFQLVVCE